jgi:predicted dehydrogenase
MPSPTTRRHFLQTSSASLLAMSAQLSAAEEKMILPSALPKREKVRVGFVGIGVKGSAHVGNLLRMELKAVCDVREIQCQEAVAQAEKLGKAKPTIYCKGDWDFKRMCETEELDLVYTATPWNWHAKVCLAAMENGKHAAAEVPIATTLEDCWKLVETFERTGKHCMMMENVNYQYNELAILMMVRKGLFGELVHAEGAYMHDTRPLKAQDKGDGLWLATEHANRNGSLYPTHGIGPAAWYLNLNRGDRMDYLVSMSSNARGMELYAKEHLPEGHPKRTPYKNGDVNNCMIRTVNGVSIIIKHDTDLPRPYSRTNLVQGTRGVLRGFPEFKICIEGKDGKGESLRWSPGDKYVKEYEHPLWTETLKTGRMVNPNQQKDPVIIPGATWEYGEFTERRNGDWLEDLRLTTAFTEGRVPDFDVYDAAAWSAIAPLSEESVAGRSKVVEFPDFTRGRWKVMEPVKILGV